MRRRRLFGEVVELFLLKSDVAKAPVLLWLQGGPGGSSMFGLFVENGPIAVDKDMNSKHDYFSLQGHE